jgi:hypothetical protein
MDQAITNANTNRHSFLTGSDFKSYFRVARTKGSMSGSMTSA